MKNLKIYKENSKDKIISNKNKLLIVKEPMIILKLLKINSKRKRLKKAIIKQINLNLIKLSKELQEYLNNNIIAKKIAKNLNLNKSKYKKFKIRIKICRKKLKIYIKVIDKIKIKNNF
jgi:hypothetical protein